MAISKRTPTASQLASAQMHLDNRARWAYVRNKTTGQEYVIVPSSDRQRAYYVRKDGAGCSCPAYTTYNYSACSHMLAVREAANHDALEAWLSEPAPAPVETVRPKPSYSDLFPPTCRARGCTDDAATSDDLYCKRHQLVDAF